MSVFDAVAEPRRRRILEFLLSGDKAVGELALDLGASQPAVSKHLRTLREAGLVESRVSAQRRMYRLRRDGLRELDEWVGLFGRPNGAAASVVAPPALAVVPDAERIDRNAYARFDQVGDGRWCLRFRRTFARPVERVWPFLTEARHLDRWFPTSIEGERHPGAPLRFAFPSSEAPALSGRLTGFRPPTLMEFYWGDDLIRLQLRRTRRGTSLVMSDIIGDPTKAARDAAGWHACLDALAAALRGEPGSRQALSEWSNLYPHYVAEFTQHVVEDAVAGGRGRVAAGGGG